MQAIQGTRLEIPFKTSDVASFGGGGEGLISHRSLEGAYFVANILLVVVAAVALFVTRRQSIHAQKARVISVYMDIFRKWDAPELVASRDKLRSLLGGFDPSNAANQLDLLLRQLRNKNLPEYSEFLELLGFIEETGYLCRAEYLDIKDVANNIGSSLTYCITSLLPHVVWRRGNVDRATTVYANFIWLHEELPIQVKFAVAGYGYFAEPEGMPKTGRGSSAVISAGDDPTALPVSPFANPSGGTEKHAEK